MSESQQDEGYGRDQEQGYGQSGQRQDQGYDDRGGQDQGYGQDQDQGGQDQYREDQQP
jgi:hypothetical protein